MCGILGSVNIPIGNEALAAIRHRGPDAEALKTVDVADNRVWLGHTRLAIVDLSEAGAQPMVSACGRYHLVFNGEIYNHAELRKKLVGVTFRGHSDTETILYYLIHYGMKAVSEFNGIFAFAFLDAQRGELYMARDRFGVKPLYYHQSGSHLLFSSEMRPLLQLVDPKINREALAVLLRLRYNPAPDTLFSEIKKLRPGHIARYNLRTYHFDTFPFIRRAAQPLKSLPFREAVEEYGRLVEAAIKRQLMGDVEVGVLLSGGIDSAIVAHYAAKHYPEKLKAFTVGYTDRSDLDEIDDARFSARELNLNHIVSRVTEQNFQTMLPTIVDIVEEPSATISAVPMYYLCQSVAPHLKVVLTGQGADEPLGGYFRYKSELLYARLPQADRIAKFLGQFPKLTDRETARRAILAWQEPTLARRFDESYALFSTDEIYQLTGLPKARSEEYIQYYLDLMQGEGRNPVEAMMRNDMHMNLSDDLLNYTDKLSMHFGIETRVPFLDNDLVDFTDSLPVGYKLDLRHTKIIHKAFAESILSKEIIHRKKKGFGSPAQQWLNGESGDAFHRQLTRPGSLFSTYFQKPAINKLFDDHRQKGHNREKQLFTLMSINHWMNGLTRPESVLR